MTTPYYLFFLGLSVGFFLCLSLFAFLFVFFFGRKPNQQPINNYQQDSQQQQPSRRRSFLSDDASQSNNALLDQQLSIETCRWLNAIVDNIFYACVVKNNAHLRAALQDKLKNEFEKPDFLGDLTIREFFVGDTLPVIESVTGKEDENGLELIFGINYEGNAVLGMQTEFWINFPVKKWAALPLSFSISNFSIRGRMKIVCEPGFSAISFCFVENPAIDFVFSSEIGYKKTLKDIPKVTQILNKKVRDFIKASLVAPKNMRIETKDMLQGTILAGSNNNNSNKNEAQSPNKARAADASTAVQQPAVSPIHSIPLSPASASSFSSIITSPQPRKPQSSAASDHFASPQRPSQTRRSSSAHLLNNSSSNDLVTTYVDEQIRQQHPNLHLHHRQQQYRRPPSHYTSDDHDRYHDFDDDDDDKTSTISSSSSSALAIAAQIYQTGRSDAGAHAQPKLIPAAELSTSQKMVAKLHDARKRSIHSSDPARFAD